MTAALHTLPAETRARVAATPAPASFAARPPVVALVEQIATEDRLAGVMIAAALRNRNTQSTRCRGRFWSWHS